MGCASSAPRDGSGSWTDVTGIAASQQRSDAVQSLGDSPAASPVPLPQETQADDLPPNLASLPLEAGPEPPPAATAAEVAARKASAQSAESVASGDGTPVAPADANATAGEKGVRTKTSTAAPPVQRRSGAAAHALSSNFRQVYIHEYYKTFEPYGLDHSAITGLSLEQGIPLHISSCRAERVL